MDLELIYRNVEGEELIQTSQSDANDRQLQAAELMVSLSSSLPGGGQCVSMETQSVAMESHTALSSASHPDRTYPVIVSSYSVGPAGVLETTVATETISNCIDERGDHIAGYSVAENCTRHRGKFAENHLDHLSNNSVIIMPSGVGGEIFTVKNTEDDVELGEIEYIQDGDIITISEGNTSSSFTDIVSKSQYENICNHTTTHCYQMTSDGNHGNYITSEGNQITIDCNQATTESNHATYAGYQIISDGNPATAESHLTTNVGYQVNIDGNQATSDCNQANTNSNLAALETSMVTTNWTHGVIIDNAGPENVCDEGSGYLDGETLHVSLKGGTGQSLTLINKRRLEQMTQGSEVLVVEPKKRSHQC
ncbi:uncharacterized protein LOC127847752 isoform X2 [Dreissena polymorpha]|uniref:uncharacterized protein LOC127847752 isoform X2 n=1 Tax=Dreissena polymorpha TaxID=45954 RepID=UPI0022641307|nr:uncharacterized protein LOC127847752 isoform X2 [Dreissena polymorpha]